MGSLKDSKYQDCEIMKDLLRLVLTKKRGRTSGTSKSAYGRPKRTSTRRVGKPSQRHKREGKNQWSEVVRKKEKVDAVG